MKKISLGILLLFMVFQFSGCQKEITTQNEPDNQNTTAITTQSVAVKSDVIKWKNFNNKFIKLSGIKYPDGFWLEPNNSEKEFNVFDRLTIKSSKNLDIFNCNNTSACEKDGMLISIFSSKETVSYRDTSLNLTSDTRYLNIKKIKTPNNSNVNGVTINEYIFIPDNQDDIAYQITFAEKNFTGDASAIIDGFLESLHE